MKIVATSDWHLDASTAGVDRFKDTSGAINASVHAAIDMCADFYLMCGDLCDPNTVRAHRSVAMATAVHRELLRNGVMPIWVVGNHDVIEDGSGMSTMESLKYCGGGYVIAKPTSDDLLDASDTPRCKIIGLPFTASSHSYDPDEFIRGLDQTDPVLIVGHLNLEGITPGSETTDMPRGRDVYWPTDAIAECFPNAVVLGGHYHDPQEYNGVTIIGSIARLRFPECNNATGYIVVEV